MKHRSFFSILVLICSVVFSFSSFAQKKGNNNKPFIDTLDRAFDISHYLYNLHGFLPVISPVTEPAVGYGAIGAGLFFIPKKKNPGNKKFQMPDVAGFGGGYTQNQTWFAGAGYFGFWKDDHIRYRGAAGYGDVKLKYYGKGDGFLSEHPASFTIKAFGFVQQAEFRIANSRFLLGGKYIFTKTSVTAFEDSKLPFVDPKEFDLTNSGLGLLAEYENLDNIFSPNKGLRFLVAYDQYLELLGSDKNYGRLTSFTLYYLPIIENKWVSAFRAEFQMAIDNPPFYAYPFLILRGIPALRYQGKYIFLLETQQNLLITNRWTIDGFGGYGQTFNENINGYLAWNAGAGFRYLIARALGLRMGIDVARGPETWAFYIVVGNAWLR